MNPNLMLEDSDLSRLLAEAASSFPVPDEGPAFVLEELAVTRPHPRRSRAVKWTAAAAAVVAGVLVVQSLGGGGTASTKTTPSAAGAARSRAAVPAPSAAPNSAWSGSAWTGDAYSPQKSTNLSRNLPDTAPAATGTGSAEGPLTMAPTAGSAPAVASPPLAAAPDPGFADSAKIVKTGTIALIVGDHKVSTVITKITGIAKGAGGYIADSKSQEYGDDPSSTVTLRVPVNQFEAVVQSVRDQVKGGVGKVDSSSTSGQDVTAQYADVNAQIQSLTAARERFLVILGRANTIGETLSVQQRVDSVQQQIDSLKGRLRVLRDQTSMGTLTVTVSEKPKAEAKAHVQSGLSKSFSNAKHGFTSGVESLISKSGRGLLVLLVALVCLVILRTGWRLARRRFV